MKALIAMAAVVAGLVLLGACGGGDGADEYSRDQGSRLAHALSQIVDRPDLQHLNASDTVVDVCGEALLGYHVPEGGKRIEIAKELHDVCSELESASALPGYQALPQLIEARRHLLDWLWE